MVRIDALVIAVLDGEALQARCLAQDFLRGCPALDDVQRPDMDDSKELALAAALLELFAARRCQSPPAWTKDVGPAPQPVYLVKAVARMPRLRELCRKAAPEPLRRRGLYAPPDYLAFA